MSWEDGVRKVVPYVPGEQPKRTDIIKLNTNECPYPPAPGVKRALDQTDHEVFRLYPDPESGVLVKALRSITVFRRNRFLWVLGLMMCWRWHF